MGHSRSGSFRSGAVNLTVLADGRLVGHLSARGGRRILAQEVRRIGFLARELLDCVLKMMSGGA